MVTVEPDANSDVLPAIRRTVGTVRAARCSIAIRSKAFPFPRKQARVESSSRSRSEALQSSHEKSAHQLNCCSFSAMKLAITSGDS